VDGILVFGETNFAPGFVVSKRAGAPIIFALRSNFVDEFLSFPRATRPWPILRGLQRRLEGRKKIFHESWIMKRADQVVFQSDYDRKNVIGRCPSVETRSHVIPNSFRVAWMREEDALSNGSTTVKRCLFVGSLGPRKGIQFLIPAFRQLAGKVSLDVVGFGGLEPWARQYVEEHDLSETVRFLGRINDAVPLIANVDLLIVPSLYDSFPNTVLEALFVGTLVIGARTGGIKTMLEYEELLFDVGSDAAIAEAVTRLVDEPAAYARAWSLCQQRRGTFDFDWAARWIEVIGGTDYTPAHR
jgi:glycosyltransferase involved in cell wall biosynthesis